MEWLGPIVHSFRRFKSWRKTQGDHREYQNLNRRQARTIRLPEKAKSRALAVKGTRSLPADSFKGPLPSDSRLWERYGALFNQLPAAGRQRAFRMLDTLLPLCASEETASRNVIWFLRKDRLNSPELGDYQSYSITAYQEKDGTIEVLDTVRDISTYRTVAEAFLKLLRTYGVSPVHFRAAACDFLER